MQIKLISFKLCPFVQRSLIVLLEKAVDFDIEYIDLRNKPEWFLKLSPTGKVPVMLVDETALFESAAINEFLEETFAPPLYPNDPLLRAQNRAWIEIANQLSVAQFRLGMAKLQDELVEQIYSVRGLLVDLEAQLAAGPFFNGSDFALIDAAFAPFFTRQRLLDSYLDEDICAQTPRVRSYGAALMERDSVKNSVVADYDQLYRQRLQREGSALVDLSD